MADFVYSSLFGELTKVVQLRFDAISLLNKQLFDNVIYERYLTWDSPTVSLNFEELIGTYGITIAAATLGENSNEPVIGHEAPETLAQSVLLHALTRKMTAQTYRRILELQSAPYLTDTQRRNELIDLMFKDVAFVVEGVQARIDIIFLEALSNNGIVTFNQDTNPEGGFKGTINYGMPDENKATASIPWTDANKDTVDVLGDIQAVVDAASSKVVFDRILMDPQQLSYIMRTAKLKEAVYGTDKSATPLTPTIVNQFLESFGYPRIETIRRHVRIQDNGALKSLSPWNANNIVFVPAGSLGVVKNAYADNELQQEAGVAYSNYGRIRVSQWGVGESQNSRGTQFTKAQVYALPVITEFNGIYSLDSGSNISALSTNGAAVASLSADTTATTSAKKK